MDGHQQFHGIDDGSGPPVLFLHGLMFDAEVWRPQVDELSDRYRCVAPDFPGHGTAPFDITDTSMDGLSQWTLELLDRLGIESCHLVGFSMGGFVGLRLAATHPHRVRSLCLVASCALEESDEFREQHLRRTVPAIRRADNRVVRFFIRRTVRRQFFWRKFVKNNKMTVRFWLDRLMDFDPETMACYTESVLQREPVSPAELGIITQPVLFVWGAEDVIRHDPKERESFQESVPRTEFKEIPACGHSVPIEKPAELLGYLESHLSRSTVSTGEMS